ncbi:MAG: DUF4956 domain-containing protein [Acidobacteria bacterium]|nr:DUF4956 domain-containing protein [Acidobacteriota bacterium]
MPDNQPAAILLRLIAALAAGAAVAWIHAKSTRIPHESSFTTTLVLLSVLIAMVTQVIGDNVARAFSLVGALSIVRFRTVVRDTRDTAFVIFSVAVGMAVGAMNLWVAGLGILVIGAAAFLLSRSNAAKPVIRSAHQLTIRANTAADLHHIAQHAGSSLGALQSIETLKQGTAIEAVYEYELRNPQDAQKLVKDLLLLEGVHEVRLVKSTKE